MLCAGVGLLGFALLIGFGRQGLLELYQQKAALARQVAQIERQERINLSVFRCIQRLKNDPAYLERVAREEFLMVGPAEWVITLPDSFQAGKDS